MGNSVATQAIAFKPNDKVEPPVAVVDQLKKKKNRVAKLKKKLPNETP